MKAINLCQLLLATNQLIVKRITVGTGEIQLGVESIATRATCPKCREESTEIHSTYTRFPADLAWAGWAVVLHLQVKRFFCRNERCSKRTFAEQFPGLLARYARRTNRVCERQQRVGVEVCAKVAERLLALDRIGISDTTINRMLRMLPDVSVTSVRVLGVDDWAKRKGQNYGTILVDLERGQIVDLLADRRADTLAQWLQEHPGIEIVSRDRSKTYADAIDRGAPDAVQVADRWHLLKNLTDTVFKILQQEYATIKKRLASLAESHATADSEAERFESKLADNDANLTPAEQRRQQRIDAVQQLHNLGWTQKDIAQQLSIHPKTVRRYLGAPAPQSRRHRTGRLLDAFKPYILKRWNEGCHNASQLFREIQPQGFAGKITIVRDFVRQLRHASGLPPGVRCQNGKVLETDPTQRPPTLRSLTWSIVKRPDERFESDEQLLNQLSEGYPKLEKTINLAREFASMIRQRQQDELDAWLERADESGYQIWHNFATGLWRDHTAVEAALRLNWSNGPTEGHVNRLKCVKRQMYGRAKDDLLRKRIIWQGRWSFT